MKVHSTTIVVVTCAVSLLLLSSTHGLSTCNDLLKGVAQETWMQVAPPEGAAIADIAILNDGKGKYVAWSPGGTSDSNYYATGTVLCTQLSYGPSNPCRATFIDVSSEDSGKTWQTVNLTVSFNTADGGRSYHGWETSPLWNATTSVRMVSGPFCEAMVDSTVRAFDKLGIPVDFAGDLC